MENRRVLDHKIWRIAWPAILSNISIPLLGLVDAAILGHLGDSRYLGAVALGSALLSFFYWGFGFLRMGTTGLVARAMGARDTRAASLVLARSAVLALALAALVLATHRLWLGLGFQLMSPQPALLPLAESYTAIRIASSPAVLLTYAVVGWFIGRQDTRWPMLIVVTTNLVNIGLDFLFIIGLDMGSDGAAAATVMAEYLGCALALWAAWRRLPRAELAGLTAELRDWPAYRSLLRSNRHLFVRTVCLLASFAFFTAQGNRFGTEILAANTLLMHLLMLAAYAMDGFAFAAEGLAGTCLGAADLGGFRRVVRRCTLWCAVTAALTALVFALAQPLLFPLLTDIAAVRELMSRYAGWLVLLPLAAAPSYLLDGVFIGAAVTRPMMRTMLVSALGVYLPAWYLGMQLGWGNHGLWLSFALFNAARGATLYVSYRRLWRTDGWLRP